MQTTWLFGLFAVAFSMICAVVFAGLQQRFLQRRSVRARLRELLGYVDRRDLPSVQARKGLLTTLATNQLKRAGFVPAPWMLSAGIAALLLAALFGVSLSGMVGLLLYPMAALGAGWLFLLYRARRRRRMMIEQTPTFIDHLMRAVSTGNTLDAAIMSATAEARDPLRPVFDQVVRDIRLGGELEEALEEATRTYDIDELRILSLAVRVNRKYGSSIQDLLKSVVILVRRAEAARREFKAMTGETRLSAWVLSLLPIMLAAYIIFTNPEYLGHLLYDETGRVILIIAIVLQAIGAFILWRMTRVF
jgi:tight adherence protein B